MGQSTSNVQIFIFIFLVVETRHLYWKNTGKLEAVAIKRYIYHRRLLKKFKSYEDVRCQYKLEGQQHFWKYLQIINSVKSRIQICSENPILGYT